MPAGERVYAIGDVHGEADLLQRLLMKVHRDNRALEPARVTLVLLGDIIDRGARSVDLLYAICRFSSPFFRILKGNHEALLVDAYRGSEDALDLWLRIGGRSTLIGLGIDPAMVDTADLYMLAEAMRSAIDPMLIERVDDLPTAWSMGDYFFAHAGIRPGIALDRQSDHDLMWVRDVFLSSRAHHGKVVVHGHSIEPGVPRLGGNRIGLDTGAHEHRRLTALGLEGDRQWLLQEDAPETARPENTLPRSTAGSPG